MRDWTGLRHVLIVTQNFPPTNEISARRFGFIAPRLADYGWTPWVLTTHGTGPLPVRVPEERVFRIGRNSNRLPATLADLKTRSASTRLAESARSVARWLIERTGTRIYTLYPANLDWYRQVQRSEDAIRRWLGPVDVVIGSFMPSGALLVAAYLARTLGVPWLADIRDLPSHAGPGRNPAARGADRWIERRLFRTASGFLTVSPTLAQLLQSAHRRPAAVIYNGWDLEGETDSASRAAADGDAANATHPAARTTGIRRRDTEHPYLHYAGLLLPQRMRAAELILEALCTHSGVRWKLRSLGPASLEKRLIEHARRLGIADRVEMLSPADPAVIQSECESALANVVLEDVTGRDIGGRGTLTGKFLKLLPLKPAVLAVARPDSDIGPILARTGKGRLCSTASDVAALLHNIDSEPGLFHGNTAAVAEFSMAAQAASLARLLDERMAA
jgi:glycosyltransferase involved in cell wall biosynthesis